MKRGMCAYLPGWPLQRLWRDQPRLRSEAVAVVSPRGARGPRVLLASRLAVQAGVRPGMPVAEANAVAPHVLLEEEDAERDLFVLKEVAAWAERFTPLVGVEDVEQPGKPGGVSPRRSLASTAPSSLFLDITGCADCFGGEDALLNRAAVDFTEEGWNVRLAIADTLGAAWALAHFAPGLAPPGETEKTLAPLPVAGLRLDPETLGMLSQLGIETIRQLLELPRASLALRFPDLLLTRLDQALGRLPEVLRLHRFDPEVEAIIDFEYPVDRLPLLRPVLEQLTRDVEACLKQRNLGARQVECALYFTDAPPRYQEIGLFRPAQSAEHLCRMLMTHLDQVRLDGPVCGMGLRVAWAEPVLGNQQELFEPAPDWGVLSNLLDQLSNRLGRDAVTRAELIADPQPEYACRLEPAVETRKTPFSRRSWSGIPQTKTRANGPPSPPASGGEGPGVRGAVVPKTATVKASGKRTGVTPNPTAKPWPLRPVKLWPQPVAVQALALAPEGAPACFRWHDEDYPILRVWGPERIRAGWWRDAPIERDYYIVATERGSRFWLFRRLQDGAWFLHGAFD
ncbi:MAG: hypothetical protein U0793_10835 [Gemmataceae bacterium]